MAADNHRMSITLYLCIQQALTAYWKAHDNQYPAKIILTPAQHESLNDLRRLAATTGRLSAKAAPGEKFMGVPIEHAPDTPGVMIAIDGTVIPLLGQPAT